MQHAFFLYVDNSQYEVLYSQQIAVLRAFHEPSRAWKLISNLSHLFFFF